MRRSALGPARVIVMGRSTTWAMLRPRALSAHDRLQKDRSEFLGFLSLRQIGIFARTARNDRRRPLLVGCCALFDVDALWRARERDTAADRPRA